MIEPTVTVVIPTYREAAHIEQTLSAVRGQTYAKIVEVLVVDGRSDDSHEGVGRCRWSEPCSTTPTGCRRPA